MTSDTPRVDAVPDWNARCGAQDDEKIITHGDLLALAHDEADELRELASTLERKLNEARAEIASYKSLTLTLAKAEEQACIDAYRYSEDAKRAEALLAAMPEVAGLVARVQSLRSARHEYDDAPASELLLLDAVVEALSAGGETV